MSYGYGPATGTRDAVGLIRAAVERGVTFFDTAEAYGPYKNEEVLGEALAGFERASYVLATKVYFPVGEGPNDRGLSRKHVVEQCHASLRRLGTDHIDLYQCHRFDGETPLEETLRALDDLVRDGKVRYIGTTTFAAWQVAESLWVSKEWGLSRFVTEHPPYNLLDGASSASCCPCFARMDSGSCPGVHWAAGC